MLKVYSVCDLLMFLLKKQGIKDVKIALHKTRFAYVVTASFYDSYVTIIYPDGGLNLHDFLHYCLRLKGELYGV